MKTLRILKIGICFIAQITLSRLFDISKRLTIIW
ncbi:MAG: hypothetical protein ACI808_003021 [Paraglaciecola sp.]